MPWRGCLQSLLRLPTPGKNSIAHISAGQLDVIDHWSIVYHFAQMVDIREFLVNIILKSQNASMIFIPQKL